MKKLRFLLLSLLTMILFTFATGCEVAGNACDADGDCGDKELCYAGYCGQNEPAGMLNLKFNLREDIANGGSIHCKEANVDNVDIVVSTHGLEVYSTTVACSKVNVHEFANTTDMGEAITHLWNGEDYDVTVNFTDTVSKSFTASPVIGGVSVPSEANDANYVLLEKVQESVFTAKWDIEEANGDLHTGSSSCADLGIDNFRVALDAVEPCEIDATTDIMTCDFTDFVSIPCANVWETGITVYEASGRSIGIYAVKVDTNTGGLTVPFSIEKAVTITQAQIDDGAFDRTFHLDDLRGNKK